jgi:hypothetical protein
LIFFGRNTILVQIKKRKKLNAMAYRVKILLNIEI